MKQIPFSCGFDITHKSEPRITRSIQQLSLKLVSKNRNSEFANKNSRERLQHYSFNLLRTCCRKNIDNYWEAVQIQWEAMQIDILSMSHRLEQYRRVRIISLWASTLTSAQKRGVGLQYVLSCIGCSISPPTHHVFT